LARFELPVRVYYDDTDAAGVVYCASDLRFMTARVTLACPDAARWRPARVPAPLARVLAATTARTE
jgi:acyl-CoA thioesterase FadM